MNELRQWLDDNNIQYRDESSEWDTYFMHRTKFTIKGNDFSVINGYGSYGGISISGVNEGFLECWVNQKGEPEGYLTADDVIQKIKDLLA